MKQSRVYNLIDGFLVINKPKDWTSFDVVAKVRNTLNVKKVGHTGTLDPKATGVLVLCVGKATKLAMEITATDKEYVAEITLGSTSTTDDQEGEITPFSENPNSPSQTDIEKLFPQFTGEIEQIPPIFSAIKIDGKRAYKSARAGEEIKMKSRNVTVHELEILDYKWPVLKLRVHCGKGFYVRSLARDIGKALNVGGYLSALQRTRVGQFTIDQAITVEEVGEDKVLPLQTTY
ncbi:tRNA pseudouridine(55) synthase TruB [Candidatus Pacearchaeota archaeon]|nr:tRNA pseudouridine(55) synthase TruB [Candidatus Pacearchaeota archaeon]